MLFIVFFTAWILSSAVMAGAEWLWRWHKARSQKIRELERENRRLNTVLDFYENINEFNNIRTGMIKVDGRYGRAK